MKTNRLLKIDEVCSYLSLSKSSIYNLINAGVFSGPIKIGRSSRWRLSDLEAFVDGQDGEERAPHFLVARHIQAASMSGMRTSI